jgi:prephenate dehydrogenase
MTRPERLRLAILGTGLMGASVALGAKRAGVSDVAGFDVDEQSLAGAAERGAIDRACRSLPEAMQGTDLAVIAVPVGELPGVIMDALSVAGEECTVTDVGSTKASVCAAAGGAASFVGGHPVCGSEASGPQHASAELFDGATWFLTPVDETGPRHYRRLHAFVAALGATPVAIAPSAHDRLVALTSHFPHALANLLANQAGSSRIDGHDPLSAAGGSLRDMTRVAGANPDVWVDIFLDNRDEVLAALASHRRAVERLEAVLEGRAADGLADWIAEAAGNRHRVLRAAYAADPGELHQVRVHVADEPGVLARITQALGAERINIEDFELRHLSPERGGVLGVLVAGKEEALRAAELLEADGYGVVVSPVAGALARPPSSGKPAAVHSSLPPA